MKNRDYLFFLFDDFDFDAVGFFSILTVTMSSSSSLIKQFILICIHWYTLWQSSLSLVLLEVSRKKPKDLENLQIFYNWLTINILPGTYSIDSFWSTISIESLTWELVNNSADLTYSNSITFSSIPFPSDKTAESLDSSSSSF